MKKEEERVSDIIKPTFFPFFSAFFRSLFLPFSTIGRVHREQTVNVQGGGDRWASKVVGSVLVVDKESNCTEG